MIKAKTNKRILSILCAILSAVFALITGFTFCATTLNLKYGTNELSTTAYMANNQFTLINDTLSAPVAFGEGAHNFEIALKYAIDYEFDFRIDYSLQWKNADGTNNAASTENVILNFANRDNFIVDENHIFYVNYSNNNPSGVQAGDGKIIVITGVEYIDVTDETYNGLYLTITADVEVYQTTNSYSSTHELLDDSNETSIATTESAKAWLQYKNSKSTTAWQVTSNSETITYDAYVMMYNFRRDYNHGVKFPGARTAYQKTLNGDKVDQAKWLGGNRAYAGINMYIITGVNPVKLKVKVKGIWRESPGVTTGMYENSIKFTYSNKWHSLGVDDINYIHETCAYSMVIPAYTSCYIDILDNLEVVSAGVETITSYDSHRAIANTITINNKEFNYTTNSNYIQNTLIKTESELAYVNSSQTGTYNPTENYSKADVNVSSLASFSNNLYLSDSEQQTYYTNLTLINNTAQEQVVNITDYKLNYHVSNGNFGVYGIDETPTFNGGKYYTDYVSISSTLKDDEGESYFSTIGAKSQVVIAPYSSVCVCDNFSVNSNFKTKIQTDYSGLFDVWVQLVPIYSVVDPQTNPTSNQNGLVLETKYNYDITNPTVSIFVKNNTNNIVKNISITNLTILGLGAESFSGLLSEPSDWKSSYWNYYTKNGNDYIRLESYQEFGTGKDEGGNTKFYSRTIGYGSNIMALQQDSDFTVTSSVYSSKEDVAVKPGDSLLVTTISAKQNSTVYTQFMLTGNVTATSKSAPANETVPVMIINNGSANAYLVNESEENSYFVRFTGEVLNTAESAEYFTYVEGENYSYYIGVLRPKQIINIPLTEQASLEAVKAEYLFKDTNLSAWNDDVENELSYIFSTVKKTT